METEYENYPSGRSEVSPSPDESYSGQCHSGLNANASYDRMTYLDHNNIQSPQSLLNLTEEVYEAFIKSERSRLVIRLLSDPSVDSQQLSSLNRINDRAEIDYYPDSEGRFNYLTISFNKENRSISDQDYSIITNLVRSRVNDLRMENGQFEAQSLEVLNQASEIGLRPTLNIGVQELSELWQDFGWSREAVQSILTHTSKDIVMGMRNEEDRLVSAVLYNDQSHEGIRHGETTEWIVNDRLRGSQIIHPLLLTFHSYLLEQGIKNVWADLRTPDPMNQMANSVRPALRGGMRIFNTDHHPFIASNHVTISGMPQSYNAGSERVFGSDTAHDQLRSFVRGWMDPNLFTERLRERCMEYLQEGNI